MTNSLWDKCLQRLEGELSPQQFNTWIRPLHAVDADGHLRLLAPNRFVLDWVSERFLKTIEEFATDVLNKPIKVSLEIGSQHASEKPLLADGTEKPEIQVSLNPYKTSAAPRAQHEIGRAHV